jgi:hypothetical protein
VPAKPRFERCDETIPTAALPWQPLLGNEFCYNIHLLHPVHDKYPSQQTVKNILLFVIAVANS